MPPLTKQERLFFDRVALKIQADPHLTIEQAAQLVVNDDARILNRYVRLREDEREHLHKGICGIVYDAIRTRQGKG